MIVLLNCSLKGPKGNSRYFLNRLKSCLTEDCLDLEMRDVLKNPDRFVQTLHMAGALVLGAPLYVDGMPAQALALMELLHASYSEQFPHIPVYVVSNLGFYESTQIRILLDITRNWCKKMDLTYGGGVAIGAGGLMSAFKGMPLDALPNKALFRGMKQLAGAVSARTPIQNLYVQPTCIPRFVYMIAAHRLFRSTGRKNGVKV